MSAAEVELRRWLASRARPLPLDPTVPLEALPEALSRAVVVGVASAVRSARELVVATHVLLRALVERHGFRAVAIEGAEETGAALDRFVRTGEGDPAALLAESQSFLRMREVLVIVRWLREWAEEHPDDPVSVVHDLAPAPPPGGLAEIEADLARRDLAWRSATGERLVHWGGTAHLVVGDPRTVPPGETHRNAGGILRAELGDGYGVAALTVGSGAVPFPLPPPPRDFAEAALAEVPHEAALLEVLPRDVPHPVAEWAHLPLRTRMIGPVYDAARDHAFRVDAGRLLDCVDVLVHVPRVTGTSSLGAQRNS